MSFGFHTEDLTVDHRRSEMLSYVIEIAAVLGTVLLIRVSAYSSNLDGPLSRVKKRWLRLPPACLFVHSKPACGKCRLGEDLHAIE